MYNNYIIPNEIIERRKRVFNKIHKNYKEYFSFIVDTREQDTFIYENFKSNDITVIQQNINIGDFGFFLNDIPDCDNNFCKIAIERKKNLIELMGNLFDTKSINDDGTNRFERELLHAKCNDYDFRLFIETNYLHDLYNKKYLILNHNTNEYKNNYSIAAIAGKLETLQVRYKCPIQIIQKIYMPSQIINTLLYSFREMFIFGEDNDCDFLRDYFSKEFNLKKEI